MAGQGKRGHLIDEKQGEGDLISANPLPSDVVGSPCSPSSAIAGSEDLVGASGGDQGKECEEITHVVEGKKTRAKVRGRREGER